MTLILGVDPGLANTGYALLKTDGRGFTVERVGTIQTLSTIPLEKRLL